MRLIILISILFYSITSESQFNRRAKQSVNAVGLGYRFGGRGADNADESDHFKLLALDGDSLLVGAKNAVYNLSLTTLKVHHTINWAPPASIIEECMMKGKSKGDCQNYIRVLASQSNGKCLICGTHAFSPKCREYSYDAVDGQLKDRRQFDGVGISPFDPRDNSTALFLPESNEIFTGTVSDFIGNDPLIYKKNINNAKDVGLRTSRSDARVLDSPNFVGSFAFGDYVYYWYREWAAEAMDNNEERQIYSRVARVCKRDRGGARPANERWTSFIKARLNCSLPSSTPFYFNEIKAVSDPIPSGSDHTVYAVFSTPESALQMTAVCSFSMKKINDLFEYDTFKYQRAPNSIWEPYSRNEIPKPRPGSCVPDSTKLPETTISFLTRNPLIHRAVESKSLPLLIEGSDRPDLTQITVLSGVKSVSGQKYNILYLGTSDGRIMKTISIDGNSTIIESTNVFGKTNPVVNLLSKEDQLVIVSPDEIAALPLHHCGQQTSCSRCVGLQDPHCAWDLNTARCVNSANWNGGHFIQNIEIGMSAQCPEGIIIQDAFAEDSQIAEKSAIRVSSFSNQNLILACVLSTTVALLIGGLIGLQLGKARALSDQHHSASSTSGSDYDSYGRARLTRHDSLTTSAKMEHVYGAQQKASMDATSMVLTMPGGGMSISQHGSGINTPSRDKNAIMTSINQNTLPRDYKVKKVYL
ncbi:unnamed protein product [Auanema sp. JU1783]|nr:unnamed protein product [Auanema sp. JU1783]